MTAGLRNQSLTGTKVTLAPAAIGGLLAAALLAGGLLGVAAKAEYDSLSANPPAAQGAASSAASAVRVERSAQIAVGRGPLVRDAATAATRARIAGGAVDHIGLTERLMPVSTPHRIEHGPLP